MMKEIDIGETPTLLQKLINKPMALPTKIILYNTLIDESIL